MPTTPDIVISPANEAYKVPDNRAAKATTATAQKSRTGETMLSLQWYGSKGKCGQQVAGSLLSNGGLISL